MFGVAFKLLDLASDFVDIGQQSAGRLAIEAGGGDKRIVSFLTTRPGLRIKLGPVIPTLLWWIRREMAAAWTGVKCPVVFTHSF
jgi:hypothetical protein